MSEIIKKMLKDKKGRISPVRNTTDTIKYSKISNGVSLKKTEINGRVWSLALGDGLYTTSPAQRLLLREDQLGLQSFIFASFRLDKQRHYKEYNSYYRQTNSQPERKVNKEFTCQCYGKDGFGNICQITRNKFSSVLFNNYHRLKSITRNNVCQDKLAKGVTKNEKLI